MGGAEECKSSLAEVGGLQRGESRNLRGVLWEERSNTTAAGQGPPLSNDYDCMLVLLKLPLDKHVGDHHANYVLKL